MKNFVFIFFLFTAAVAATSCEPAHQGAYEAPSRTVDGGDEEKGDLVLKIDSSVEKAIMKDSLKKRDYHL